MISERSTTSPGEPAAATLCYYRQTFGDRSLDGTIRAQFERFATPSPRPLAMARRVLRGGREHADMGGAVCSVAAGHGRNWGAGAVTGCYGPLLLGTCDRMGALTPRIELADAPPALLSLVSDDAVRFYNGSGDVIPCRWRQAEAGRWHELSLSSSSGTTAPLS